jgi:hypothetical protein
MPGNQMEWRKNAEETVIELVELGIISPIGPTDTPPDEQAWKLSFKGLWFVLNYQKEMLNTKLKDIEAAKKRLASDEIRMYFYEKEQARLKELRLKCNTR